MTRLFDIESAFARTAHLDKDEIRWLIRVAREASALCADSCLCSRTVRDIARLKRLCSETEASAPVAVPPQAHAEHVE